MNPNNGNSNNHAATIKALTNASNEANTWSAFVPYLLSDNHNEINVTLIGIFSMVRLQTCKKELCFETKCKPSEKTF